VAPQKMAVKVGTNFRRTENYFISFWTFTCRYKETAMKDGNGTTLGRAEYSLSNKIKKLA
jgi:hypothetical protein